MWTWMRMFQWSVWPLSGFLPFFPYPWSLCSLIYLCHLCFVAPWWFWTTLKNGMKVFRLFSSNYVWMKQQAMLEWRWNYRGLAKIWRNFDGLSLSLSLSLSLIYVSIYLPFSFPSVSRKLVWIHILVLNFHNEPSFDWQTTHAPIGFEPTILLSAYSYGKIECELSQRLRAYWLHSEPCQPDPKSL